MHDKSRVINIRRKTLCIEEKDKIIIKTRLSKSSHGYYFNVSKCGAIQFGKTYEVTVVSAENGKELVHFKTQIRYLKGIGYITDVSKEIEYYMIRGLLEHGKKYYLIFHEISSETKQ